MNRDFEVKEYYYKKFRDQFTEFLRKSDAHKHPGKGTFISIQDLNKENLSHIPREDYVLFHCALACTILIDQVVYTYFKNDYQKFQQMTLYPKIEYGITNINVNPWTVTHSTIDLNTLKQFLEFFVDDIKSFFKENKFKEATWDAVRMAMLSDKDVISGSRGEVLKRILENQHNNILTKTI